MYWYTRFYARRFDSGALMADAWHHRSDALSSIGAFVGIAGARAGFPWMDAVASLAICVFIVKAAYDIFRDAIEKMVDRSCGEDLENAISACATGQDGVLGIESIKTRVFGNRIYVVLEVFADGDLALRESDRIAKRVHDAIERKFGKIKHIAVFMKPRPD
jgi:cation diffusion facilitator family transporter